MVAFDNVLASVKRIQPVYEAIHVNKNIKSTNLPGYDKILDVISGRSGHPCSGQLSYRESMFGRMGGSWPVGGVVIMMLVHAINAMMNV